MKKSFSFYEDGKRQSVELDVDESFSSDGGRMIKRGFTSFNSGRPVPITYYEDGSSTIHCGGPCGSLFVDKFGNT